MATILSHAVAAAAIGSVFSPRLLPRWFWILGGACAMLPDADVIGFSFGIKYGDFLGHRGFTHSLCFAAMLAVALTCVQFRRPVSKPALLLFLFLATASHGVLDALTNGGLGIAFFSPFDNGRYFFSFTPIQVSPIGAGFFSERGVAVMLNEVAWIWLPAIAIIMICTLIHRPRTPATDRDSA